MKLCEVVDRIEDVIIFRDDMAMFCRNDLVSIDGVCTTLYFQKGIHTKIDLKLAKYKAKSMWDVVRFNVVRLKN